MGKDDEIWGEGVGGKLAELNGQLCMGKVRNDFSPGISLA